MEILRHNHKYPRNRGRILVHSTKEMAIRKAGTQIGVTLEVNHLDNTFTVILTPDETQQLIQSLLKER